MDKLRRIGTVRSHRSVWGLEGSGDLIEYRVFGIWFYRQITSQRWSPNMHEFERERGIRIGHRRFGMTETVRRFYDGKEPAIERKAYP